MWPGGGVREERTVKGSDESKKSVAAHGQERRNSRPGAAPPVSTAFALGYFIGAGSLTGAAPARPHGPSTGACPLLSLASAATCGGRTGTPPVSAQRATSVRRSRQGWSTGTTSSIPPTMPRRIVMTIPTALFPTWTPPPGDHVYLDMAVDDTSAARPRRGLVSGTLRRPLPPHARGADHTPADPGVHTSHRQHAPGSSGDQDDDDDDDGANVFDGIIGPGAVAQPALAALAPKSSLLGDHDEVDPFGDVLRVAG